MTEAERQAALEAVARDVRACTRCRLHQERTNAVPGEGHPSTEVVVVGEGPGRDEDREGRPFVGRSGQLLTALLRHIHWPREQVFITNVVKCRPPGNRDPQPDEVAACAPYLRRQLEILDPALVITLGRFSLGSFLPGGRIGQVHGTTWAVDPATGAQDASALAMYHPAFALRDPANEDTLYRDISGAPAALLTARERREASATTVPPASTAASVAATGTDAAATPAGATSSRVDAETDDQLDFFQPTT